MIANILPFHLCERYNEISYYAKKFNQKAVPKNQEIRRKGFIRTTLPKFYFKYSWKFPDIIY